MTIYACPAIYDPNHSNLLCSLGGLSLDLEGLCHGNALICLAYVDAPMRGITTYMKKLSF
jgi:hypothetical protein